MVRTRLLRLGTRRKMAATVAAAVVAAGLGGVGALGIVSSAHAADWVDSAAATAQALPAYASTYANHGIRVAPGVNPPTNSWLSPAVFVGDGVPKPVFTGPLAVRPAAGAFGVYQPVITGTTTTVHGGYDDASAVSFAPPGATGYSLTRKDSLSADLTYVAGSRTLGALTMAQGWAYAQYTASSAQSLALTLPADPTPTAGGLLVTAPAGPRYLLVTGGTLTGRTLALAAGQSVWAGVVAPNASAGDLAALVHGAVPLHGATTSYAVDARGATTTYAFDTGSAPTVFAAMPAQKDISGTRLTTTYPSINGPMPAVTGTSFSTTTTAYDMPIDLDLSTMTSTDRATLTGLVRADAPVVATIDSDDSYFGGKKLARAVQVYRLAKQLGMTAEAATVRAAVIARLDQWLDPAGCATRATSCFSYDSVLGGLVGQQPSFGSDSSFNDHYFHYGYMLYAAGVLASEDPSLVTRWHAMGDALAADIAATHGSPTTITRRNFDDYAGHGWASGDANFLDGNNQESTSEATNAWVGVTLWGRASGNADLATEGQWMFSREADSAVSYWLRPTPVPGFTSPMASLLWGGKKDFATWFSAEPSAIIGIQVIPAAPAQLAYLRSVGAAQLKVLADSSLGGGIAGKPLVDWSIALTSLGDQARAQAAYAQLSDADIDNGDSRSYLFALLHTTGTTTVPGSPPPTSPPPTSTATTAPPTTAPTTPPPTTTAPTTAPPTTTAPTTPPATSVPCAPTTTATPSPTTTAVPKPLDAFAFVPATSASALTGLTIEGASTSQAANGASAGFLLDLGTGGYGDVALTVSSGAAGGVSGLVRLRLDTPTGPVLGDASVATTGGWDVQRVVPANATAATGVHMVYVTFESGQPAPFVQLWGLQFRHR